MFTGIIEDIGQVASVEERRGQRRLNLMTGFKDLALGESIAVNGVCLTVSECGPKGEASFFISEESLERSNLKSLGEGMKVNLERAVRADSRLGGHYVQGHVDTTALLLNISEGNDHHKLTVALDPKYGRYCVEKGSIAINGVSLTINQLIETKRNEFMISLLLVPHTFKHTSFRDAKTGDQLNVEVDILAKYIERLCPQHWQAPLSSSETAN